MSTLRGFVYRKWHPDDDDDDHGTRRGPWTAYVGRGMWRDVAHHVFHRDLGYFPTQPEAIAAVCQRLKEEAALTGDVLVDVPDDSTPYSDAYSTQRVAVTLRRIEAKP